MKYSIFIKFNNVPEGTEIFIDKDTITAIEDLQNISEKPTCMIYTVGASHVVAHTAQEVIESIGAVEGAVIEMERKSKSEEAMLCPTKLHQ